MMLPKINDSLKFETTVPSTGETFKYRPYLVKEEKVLLQAFESGDIKMTVRAMIDTIEACCLVPMSCSINELPTFDLEFLFTQIRAKSVGETSDIVIKCGNCGERNPHSIDLSEIAVDFPHSETKIPITDDITVEMQYPKYDMVLRDGFDLEESDSQITINMVIACMKNVLTNEERIDCSTLPHEELQQFVESMTTDQFKRVSEFLEKLPSMKKTVKFNCIKCGEEDELELKGLSDFF